MQPVDTRLATIICEQIADGMPLRQILRQAGMPNPRVWYEWLATDDDTAKRYARATEMRADAMADEILSIADDGTNDTKQLPDGREIVDADVLGRSRLRVDARKWLLSKMAPKKYGDRIVQEHTGDLSVNVGGVALEFIRPNHPSEDGGSVRASVDDAGEV